MQKKTITKTGISYLNSPTTDSYGTLNLWVTRNLYLPVIAKYTVDIHRGDRSELLLYFSCENSISFFVSYNWHLSDHHAYTHIFYFCWSQLHIVIIVLARLPRGSYLYVLFSVMGRSRTYWEIGTGLLCLFFYLLCYAAVFNFFTYYAQYYAHVKELCLKSDCSIRIYSLIF